jgi:hypothetical protein
MERERIYLRVPFKDKDEAKRSGARRDATTRKWYVTGERRLAAFEKWLTAIIL